MQARLKVKFTGPSLKMVKRFLTSHNSAPHGSVREPERLQKMMRLNSKSLSLMNPRAPIGSICTPGFQIRSTSSCRANTLPTEPRQGIGMVGPLYVPIHHLNEDYSLQPNIASEISTSAPIPEVFCSLFRIYEPLFWGEFKSLRVHRALCGVRVFHLEISQPLLT